MRRITQLLAIMLLSAPMLWAQVEVEIIDGADNAQIKSAIEDNASRFLTEIGEAYAGSRPLALKGVVGKDAEARVTKLWKYVHFRPDSVRIAELLVNTANGYQIRNIPLRVLPQDTKGAEEYKEGAISFDRNGEISSFDFTIDSNIYRGLMEDGVKLDDVQRRMEILEYVEHFRTSYNEKDLAFLNQVFSDDALIITGKVITPRRNVDGLSISSPKLKYTKQSKQQYLANLKRVFHNVKYIDVKFDDVTIRRHGVNPNIYGVRVVQHWRASNYSDEGYVFMVWDFTNANAPQIHVRTWQPKYLDKANTKPLPEDEIFDLNTVEGI